jgi:uncharacterized membrane protein SpoIIM required for sporulation
MAAIRLKSYEFRRERERSWRQLELLLDRAERRGVRSLSGDELMRLPRLYRNALSSLSVARSISLDRNMLDYLEALGQRAYLTVYGVRRHLREAIADFFAASFPRAVRAFRWHLLLATAFLVIGTVAGYLLVSLDSDRFYTFVGADMAGGRTPAASTASLREALYSDSHTDGDLAAFASFLFTHNARVGMICFALGFIAGIPVFLLLLTNGLLLGAFWSLYASRGLGGEFWAWISPHGVTELLAVLLCSAGGLVLAHALVFPGRHTRLRSLAVRGRRAGTLVIGSIVMFLAAGLIEGVFRQTVHDMGMRWTVAFASALFWIGYLGFAGRDRRAT